MNFSASVAARWLAKRINAEIRWPYVSASIKERVSRGFRAPAKRMILSKPRRMRRSSDFDSCEYVCSKMLC